MIKDIEKRKKWAKQLELSITDGKYYPEGCLPSGHESHGGFSFGRACAKTQLKETNEK